MAMTLRLPPELEDELRQAAQESRRSMHQQARVAIEEHLASRETAEVLADPETLRSLAEARASVAEGDVIYGVDAARDLLNRRSVS